MSYYGAKFPEGIDPGIYREIRSLQDISCPAFRRSAQATLRSLDTTSVACQGCYTPGAVIMSVDLEGNERFFVLRHGDCIK